MIRSLLASLVLVSFSFAQPPSTLPNPELSSTITLLEHWIDNQMSYRGLPGLAIGVVYDQQLVYAGEDRRKLYLSKTIG